MELGKIYIKKQKYENLFDYEEALLKGNLFSDLYNKYKCENKPKENLNKKQRVLYLIMQYMFVLTDINLFLDVNPEDKKALKDFDIVSTELKKLINYYERNYHTIIQYDNYQDHNYDWATSLWPWEIEI